MKLKLIVIALGVLAAPFTYAEGDAAPHAPGIESKHYQWNKQDKELKPLLHRKGDAERGKEAYEECRGCHKANAEGRPDAGYPQLAGQLVPVLIKQMLDTRKGRRDNPRMHPFIESTAVPLNDIPDIAAYLHSLPVPTTNRKGSGENLAKGKTLYNADCASCHGDAGEGKAEKFYPRVASQHYPYLYRENIDIRDKTRRNSNPKMVKVLKKYSDEDIEAVSDYMSRLPPIND
jgi:cytochrome c553